MYEAGREGAEMLPTHAVGYEMSMTMIWCKVMAFCLTPPNCAMNIQSGWEVVLSGSQSERMLRLRDETN